VLKRHWDPVGVEVRHVSHCTSKTAEKLPKFTNNEKRAQKDANNAIPEATYSNKYKNIGLHCPLKVCSAHCSCRRFGLSPFSFVAVLVRTICCRFGLSLFWPYPLKTLYTGTISSNTCTCGIISSIKGNRWSSVFCYLKDCPAYNPSGYMQDHSAYNASLNKLTLSSPLWTTLLHYELTIFYFRWTGGCGKCLWKMK